ncbi:two-component system, sensor histidine kinase RegB [Sphingomonas gellani]|uniref:histidine kinase n=1 Tax=Sphingomonas gellani TaxID=1166340 RepID=A0A1H8AIL2_9SPHN|nr:ATP-binding protein [Sphingomonas gellani]SEM70615.1 two-component system, sensor histidine kinase RegB [Sphingomonas gellani]
MMDAPLLALTRTRPAPDGRGSEEMAATDTMRQLVQLRWMAVIGQVATILVAHFGLGVPLPLLPMLAVAAGLALANGVVLLILQRFRVRNAEVVLTLLLDMAALTLQLYFSGGAENPFASLYLLQVVLGAIVLEGRWAALLLAATSLCYGLLIVAHVPLVLPGRVWVGFFFDADDLHTVGSWLSFVTVATLLVMFITRISRSLRARDSYLADLRQHAAEEDGIVRMGLFASGAAHELGTPLGSLSVILADWRRMPRIAYDPELAGEVAEMQGEVDRCKAIVTDILHSAGEPRGEAMAGVLAGMFLDEVTEAWRDTHAAYPLDYRRGAMAHRIVAEPALRQAIWNLLDNAAEASDQGASLTGEVADGTLTIAVRDRGPGFVPGQLATVGRLYQSSKGAGHGLGLFLATNVARRMGGRLEALNPKGGGAEVRLVLPVLSDGEDD